MKLVKPDLKTSIEELLCSAQLIALSLVFILSGTTPRSVIIEYPASNVTIFVDFRSVMIFPFDYPLIVFIVLGLIRTVMSKPWRATLRRMFDRPNQTLIYWVPFVGFTLMSALWATYPLLAAVAAVRLLLYGSAAVIVLYRSGPPFEPMALALTAVATAWSGLDYIWTGIKWLRT